jgi:hypothetical protein
MPRKFTSEAYLHDSTKDGGVGGQNEVKEQEDPESIIKKEFQEWVRDTGYTMISRHQGLSCDGVLLVGKNIDGPVIGGQGQ